MKRRNENIRRDCDEINRWCDAIMKLVNKNSSQLVIRNAMIFTEIIKDKTHSIKRTTWRGRETKFFIQKPSTTNMEVKLDVEQIPYY